MRPFASQRFVLPAAARKPVAVAFAVAAALPLCGCLFSIDQIAAGLDIPKVYREAPRKPDVALPDVLWWRGFRSKELIDLIEEALTSNLDIAAAVARIVQADAQARIVGAALLPILDFSGEGSRVQQPGGSPRNSITGMLSASYEIDFWGKNWAALRAAEDNAVASRFDREVVALSTIATVANTYFLVLASYDRLRVAQDNIAAASRVYNLIKQRFDVGTASALDVAQQESVLNTQRASVPPLQQILRQSKATLAVLVGRPPEAVAIRGGSMGHVARPPVTPGIPSDLLAQRPDIREAESLLAAANANVYSARAAFFPTISLTGDGGYQSSALRTLLRPESAFFNLAANLTQPIFDGGRLRGLYDLSKGRQDELLQLYRKAVINGFADVDRALVAVQQTAARERLQREVVRSTRQAFEIAETRLREGTVDLVTVLNTQTALFQAQDLLAQNSLDRLQALVGLFQALGGGWKKPKDELSDKARRHGPARP
jgi:NodT family efflux transporter outer membrane factor (OMF) lipoprotein